jgi:hypothetical protein
MAERGAAPSSFTSLLNIAELSAALDLHLPQMRRADPALVQAERQGASRSVFDQHIIWSAGMTSKSAQSGRSSRIRPRIEFRALTTFKARVHRAQASRRFSTETHLRSR